jgi:hypothetical protein
MASIEPPLIITDRRGTLQIYTFALRTSILEFSIGITHAHRRRVLGHHCRRVISAASMFTPQASAAMFVNALSSPASRSNVVPVDLGNTGSLAT